MNLAKYSSEELRTLKKDIDKEITSRRKDEEKQAREELKQVADKYGFSLGDLIGGAKARSSVSGRSKGPAKFQHPEDESKTWTGRGRKPQWIKEWEGAGRSLDQLRVA